jgi:histone H3/H4
MQNLTRAHEELFRRTPDETFPTLQSLWEHCHAEKERSTDRWRPPQTLRPVAEQNRLVIDLGEDNEPFGLNDWSFSQLCGLAGVSKDTVNRVSADTASRVFRETLPEGNKPLQLFTADDLVRSIHGHSYTRLHNADLITMLREFATDFQPPQQAAVGGTDNKGGGTGLYCGEQDLFCFLIDPTGWAEIDGQAFAPGFYVWNSEVGKRSVGISTFWFQAVCRNHIIWDATEVVEFTRKHTGKVGEALGDIRRIVEALVEKRDSRKDGFIAVMKKAMESKLGEDAEETMKALTKAGITKSLAKRAIEVAAEQGRFTIFALVDALTRIARELPNAGERTDADQKAAGLLELVN